MNSHFTNLQLFIWVVFIITLIILSIIEHQCRHLIDKKSTTYCLALGLIGIGFVNLCIYMNEYWLFTLLLVIIVLGIAYMFKILIFTCKTLIVRNNLNTPDIPNNLHQQQQESNETNLIIDIPLTIPDLTTNEALNDSIEDITDQNSGDKPPAYSNFQPPSYSEATNVI